MFNAAHRLDRERRKSSKKAPMRRSFSPSRIAGSDSASKTSEEMPKESDAGKVYAPVVASLDEEASVAVDMTLEVSGPSIEPDLTAARTV